jgi:alpha-1,2-mannosyltransferase
MSRAAAPALGRPRLASTAVLVAVAAAFLVTLIAAAGTDRLAYDFHGSYLDAAESIRESGTPWAADAELPYWYPPALAELVLPLTFVPEDVASFVAFLVSFLAVMGALALVGVRDVRCYAAVVIWAPGWNAFEMANVTALLTLAAALAWRYRDKAPASAGAIGSAIALKSLLWPLLVWMVAMGRARTAGLALAVALGITLTTWGILGFTGLTSYADRVSEFPFERSFSFVGMTTALGWDPTIGRVAMVVTGGALLGAVLYFGRRRDDVAAFTCAIVAALAFAPVVWLHYLVLLSVPLAVARPRFSPIWLVPILLWVCPREGHGDGLQPFLPALVVAVLLVAILVQPRPLPKEWRLVAAEGEA